MTRPLWTPRGAPVPAALLLTTSTPATPPTTRVHLLALPYCEPWDTTVVAAEDDEPLALALRVAVASSASPHGGDDDGATTWTSPTYAGAGTLRVWLRGERGAAALVPRHAWEEATQEQEQGQGQEQQQRRVAVSWTACSDDPDEPFFMQVLLAIGSVASALAVVAVIAAQKMEETGKRA